MAVVVVEVDAERVRSRIAWVGLEGCSGDAVVVVRISVSADIAGGAASRPVSDSALVVGVAAHSGGVVVWGVNSGCVGPKPGVGKWNAWVAESGASGGPA